VAVLSSKNAIRSPARLPGGGAIPRSVPESVDERACGVGVPIPLRSAERLGVSGVGLAGLAVAAEKE
jgi:hypothetical protein